MRESESMDAIETASSSGESETKEKLEDKR